MSLTRVNLLNIVLMFAAVAFAFAVPFEAFLVAYAVLGPLHYLTQISWLHDRGYFTAQRRDWVPLVVLTVAITALHFAANGTPPRPDLLPLLFDLLFAAFGLALVLAIVKDPTLRVLGTGAVVVLAFLLHGATPVTFLAIYLPTLIHVFVFTGAFVLYGALKHRSASAHASLLVFAACGAATLWLDPGTLGYAASDYARQAYHEFGLLHVFALRDLLPGAVAVTTETPRTIWFPLAGYEELFTSPASVRIGRFIAFAYVYHYLNWFSKTSVIRWHEVPRWRMAVIAVLWVGSVGLYAYDYTIGLRWLLLLSIAHVLLELPLDHRTFVAIGGELAARMRGRAGARA